MAAAHFQVTVLPASALQVLETEPYGPDILINNAGITIRGAALVSRARRRRPPACSVEPVESVACWEARLARCAADC